MRESEMRQRIEGFLKRRMQGMLAPALGLGLAVAGCGKSTVTPAYSAPNPDGHAVPIEDAVGLTHDTAGATGDSSVDSVPTAPDSSPGDAVAVNKDASGPETRLDLAPEADANVEVDLAKIPDGAQTADLQTADGKTDTSGEVGAGMDTGTGADAGADVGGIVTKYMAQLPDAGRDLGAAPLYLAQLPDANRDLGATPRYMALLPLG